MTERERESESLQDQQSHSQRGGLPLYAVTLSKRRSSSLCSHALEEEVSQEEETCLGVWGGEERRGGEVKPMSYLERLWERAVSFNHTSSLEALFSSYRGVLPRAGVFCGCDMIG